MMEHSNKENNGNGENGENREFLPLGAGAVMALALLAVFLKLTGIHVQGWIRYAAVPVYVLLLCLCSQAVSRLINRSGRRDKEDEDDVV